MNKFVAISAFSILLVGCNSGSNMGGSGNSIGSSSVTSATASQLDQNNSIPLTQLNGFSANAPITEVVTWKTNQVTVHPDGNCNNNNGNLSCNVD